MTLAVWIIYDIWYYGLWVIITLDIFFILNDFG